MTEKQPASRRRPPPQFTPRRDSLCLCGSGLKYNRCCADRLPGSEHLGHRTRALFKEKKFKEALLACRADITQYTIWHKSHTEPALRMGMSKIGSIFEIDVKALGELVDTLLSCHVAMKMMDEFPAVLERLRDNIKDTKWQRKIIYFHALHALWPDWDENAGRRELSKLGGTTDEDDEETLQLYLDLFDDSLTFSEKQNLIDRILLLSDTLSNRIHYKGTRAVLYLMIGDKKAAEASLSEIIKEVRSTCEVSTLSSYERYRLTMALDLLGTIRQDRNLLSDAISLYRTLLKENEFSARGRASMYGLIGDCYRHKSEWDKARNAYLQALGEEELPIHKVFLSGCDLHLGNVEESATTLEDVSLEDLAPPEQIDYAFTAAALAIEMGDKIRLEGAIGILKELRIPDPYFRERRDFFLLNIQDALTSGSSRTLGARTRKLLANMTRSAASYLVLKPSFMGIGVDIGKIFEDLSEKGSAVGLEQRKPKKE